MDENSALIQAILRQDAEEQRQLGAADKNDDVYAWKTVSYQKRKRRASKPSQDAAVNSGESLPNGVDVFRPIELQSEERRRRSAEAQVAASSFAAAGDGSKRHSDEESDDGEVPVAENGVAEAKKTKPKKPKKVKVKVSVAEAASKIDAGDLGAFLADISESYESQEDVQLMRFADNFGRAFASVSGAQFPWLKTFKESNVANLVDVPLSHISEDVFKISIDWFSKRSLDKLVSFVEWSLDSVIADLEIHQGPSKGSKKTIAQQAPSKSQKIIGKEKSPSKWDQQLAFEFLKVAMFVVLAMVLRRRPEVLISLASTMKSTPKFQGQEKLPLIVWLITQASVGDLTVGLYMWAHVLLPMLGSKSTCNPQSRDLILQLVERILSAPKARVILLNGAAKKGERLVQPSSLDILMRVTFPAASTRVKATERFEAIYPILKEVALAGSPGSKAMKQLAQQIFVFAVNTVKEDIPDLSKEASDVFFWCLKQNPECYKQWDLVYLENLEASVVALRRLYDERNELSDIESLKETLKSFKQKNKKELEKEVSGSRQALLKEADRYVKLMSGRSSRGNVCAKSVAFVCVAVSIGIAVIMSQNQQS